MLKVAQVSVSAWYVFWGDVFFGSAKVLIDRVVSTKLVPLVS